MTKTVLTVDDSRTMRDMLLLTLSDAGYRVVQAEDGMHGLEVLAGETPDVIVTDINMPASRWLRLYRESPPRRQIPCAAHSRSDDGK